MSDSIVFPNKRFFKSKTIVSIGKFRKNQICVAVDLKNNILGKIKIISIIKTDKIPRFLKPIFNSKMNLIIFKELK